MAQVYHQQDNASKNQQQQGNLSQKKNVEIPMSKIIRMVLRHGQRLLVYPSGFPLSYPRNIHYPSDYGIPYIAPLIRTSDGEDLTCFFLPQSSYSLSKTPPPPREIVRGLPKIGDVKIEITPAAANARATVILFHGNGEHHWEDIVTASYLFWQKCNVLMVSYRGYSLSTGQPSEGGLRKDGQAALDWVLAQPYLAQVPIFIHGHSLGGAVSIDVASRNPTKIHALMLSCTFTSIPCIVRTWPILRHVSFFCTQRWNSEAKMAKIPRTTPVLMCSGRKDEVVPPALMDRLWQAAKRRGKKDKNKALWGARWGKAVDGDEKDTGLEEGEQKEEGGDALRDVWQGFDRGTHCGTPSTSTYRATLKNFIDQVVGTDIPNRSPSLSGGVPPSLTESDTSTSHPLCRPGFSHSQRNKKSRLQTVDRRWHYKDGKLYIRELVSGTEGEGKAGNEELPWEWFEYPVESKVSSKVPGNVPVVNAPQEQTG